jgi:hypothetical protein
MDAETGDGGERDMDGVRFGEIAAGESEIQPIRGFDKRVVDQSTETDESRDPGCLVHRSGLYA